MKAIFSFIIFASLLLPSSYAQILGVNKPLFSDAPFFNTEFIKINSIKSITGSISTKKVRDIIRTKGLKSHYTFNENGMLTTQLSSILSNGQKDTAITFYEYNETGNVEVKRKSDGEGFYSYLYQYDAKNDIVRETYSRDENIHKTKSKFELKKKYIIKTDSFSYEHYDLKQTKKIYYNSYGIKYKEQIDSYDELGYLAEEYSKFIIGNNKKKISYEYDEFGRLFKKHVFTNLSKDQKSTEVYSYDEIGNVIAVKNYNNEEHVSTKQFLYDIKTMLLSAIIIQEISNEYLKIIKYDYTFFDGSSNITQLDKLKVPENH